MKIPRKAPCPSCGAKRRTVAGADLRKAREKAGLTLRQLGAQAFPALSPSYLSEIETGAKPPTEAVVTLYESLAKHGDPSLEKGGRA